MGGLRQIRKRVLIVGSTGGLGSRIAQFLESYYSDQFDLFLLSRRGLVTPQGESLLSFDAQNHMVNSEFYKSLDQNHGPFWAVIDATGFNFSGSLTKHSWSKIPNQIEVNLLNPICLAYSFSPTMTTAGGRFIFFSSILAQEYVFGTNIYSVSKFALEKFVSNFALETRSSNLTMNCIQLGYYNFGMIKQVPVDLLENIGELSDFSKIAPTLEFILSEDSSETSGKIFNL